MAFLIVTAALLAQITGQGTYQLSGDDVQACGALAVQRNEHRAELERRNAALDAKAAALRAKQAQVEGMRATVDPKKKKAVAQYNEQITAANAERDALQSELEARARYNDETNALITSFNGKCANRSFNPTDTALLPPDQRAALQEKTTTRTIKVPVAAPKRRR